MSRRTTLKIGGPADALCTPDSIEALSQTLALAHERNWPVVAIGGGTNLLVRDAGIRGLVVATRNLRGLAREGETSVRVESGVSTGKLLAECTRWELGGVEFLGGVPGSVGGGMIMNAGTYLGEFKDVTREVSSVCIGDGTVITRTNAECGFEYRNSALPKSEIVVEARLDLTPRAKEDIQADVRALKTRRDEREPKKVSNSGSTFKNPEGDYAGRLIEAAGLKGTRVGAAEVSPKHANWLVNTGGATAADLIALIELVREKVAEHSGIELRLELKIIGDEGNDSPL
jgi:UDP-N-acetylmuramate dehydrogenase